MKPRTRLFYAGKATYRLIRLDRGFGGPYGQQRQPAVWACIDCGHKTPGTNDRPSIGRDYNHEDDDFTGEWQDKCARNGHAPCRLCGAKLPRLNCGCSREHNWRACPNKTEADRLQAQHARKGHCLRPEQAS